MLWKHLGDIIRDALFLMTVSGGLFGPLLAAEVIFVGGGVLSRCVVVFISIRPLGGLVGALIGVQGLYHIFEGALHDHKLDALIVGLARADYLDLSLFGRLPSALCSRLTPSLR